MSPGVSSERLCTPPLSPPSDRERIADLEAQVKKLTAQVKALTALVQALEQGTVKLPTYNGNPIS